MIVYHKKNSYFVPDEDAKLIPLGSYVLKDNEVISVNDLEDLTVQEETPVEPEEEITEPEAPAEG
jgi:hypothetical protein